MASYTDWDRLPLISSDVETRLYGAINSKCNMLGCSMLAIGGISDHVHVLVRFSPAVTLARLIGEMKGASSHLMTHEINPGSFSKWQGGYAAFTLSRQSLPKIIAYIKNQHLHHEQGTTIAELEQIEERITNQ